MAASDRVFITCFLTAIAAAGVAVGIDVAPRCSAESLLVIPAFGLMLFIALFNISRR